MCGVIGYYSADPKREHYLTIWSLFKESQIRGRHAFGFALDIPGSGLRSTKTFQVEDICEELAAIARFEQLPNALIGHNRYSTSGDWNDHLNNQPIHVAGRTLTFNGVISQEPRDVYERQFGVVCNTKNDGEIVLQLARQGRDWQGFVANGKFSFAGVVMDEEREVIALRNAQRPLWWAKREGAVFVASTADIFKRAGGFRECQQFAPGQPVNLKKL